MMIQMADKVEVDSHTSNDNSQRVGLAGKGDGMMMIDRDTGTALPAASRHIV